MTDNDFIAAMKRGLPPMEPPVWCGIDLATGADVSVEADVGADGALTNIRVIQPSQELA
jgi:hypothetical protein